MVLAMVLLLSLSLDGFAQKRHAKRARGGSCQLRACVTVALGKHALISVLVSARPHRGPGSFFAPLLLSLLWRLLPLLWGGMKDVAPHVWAR